MPTFCLHCVKVKQYANNRGNTNSKKKTLFFFFQPSCHASNVSLIFKECFFFQVTTSGYHSLLAQFPCVPFLQFYHK